MLEARYRGAETLNYKQADFSELKYIKIIYNDIKGEPHEFKTETNFLSDGYISLFIKRKDHKVLPEEDPKDIDVEENREEYENDPMITFREDYLRKIAEIKAVKEQVSIDGNYEEYSKKLAEMKQQSIEAQEAKTKKPEEEQLSEEELKKQEEEFMSQFEVECPQVVLLKFVIGELLYVAKTELKGIEVKASKVYFSLKSPSVLKFEQHRRFYRIDLKRLCILTGTTQDGSSDVYVARSINLSAGGVLINKLETMEDSKYAVINPEKYEKFGLIIMLEIDKILKLKARYVRQEEGKKCWRYAFEFVDISEDKTNYISKYVIGKQIEELSTEFNIKNKKLSDNILIRRPKRNI